MKNLISFFSGESKTKKLTPKMQSDSNKKNLQNLIIRHEDEEDDEDYDDTTDEIEDLAPIQERLKEGVRLKCARHSVSAEVYGEWNTKQNFKAPVYKKTLEQEKRVQSILANSFMFQNLDPKDMLTTVSAFNEVHFNDKDVIIKQGDDGNCLYIIESGEVDIYKFSETENKEVHLGVLTAGEIFGELALLYNTPRAASIIANGHVIVWKLDRECFNHIVRISAIERRELYDSFLKEVEILKDMDSYERSKLSDAIKTCTFAAGETIILQGELGDVFYIIESGTAVAIKNGVECMQYKRGDYFGELALIKNQPRAATVKVQDTPVKCIYFDRKSFCRLLGPIESILKRNAARYEQFQDSLKLRD